MSAPFFRPIERKRSAVLRVVIPLAPGAPPEWQPEVARRVSDWKARHQDRAYRAVNGLDVAKTSSTSCLSRGNEPVARSDRPATGPHKPSGWSRALPRHGVLRAVVRVFLIVVGGVGLMFLPPQLRAGLALGAVAAAILVAALWCFDVMGSEPKGGVTSRNR